VAGSLADSCSGSSTVGKAPLVLLDAAVWQAPICARFWVLPELLLCRAAVYFAVQRCSPELGAVCGAGLQQPTDAFVLES
jgi:hypothetical protein